MMSTSLKAPEEQAVSKDDKQTRAAFHVPEATISEHDFRHMIGRRTDC
jgi:hypothetical protein